MSLEEIFQRYSQALDAELKLALSGRSAALYEPMRYHLGWVDAAGHPITSSGGKGLRPTLCLLACQAVGGHWPHALPAAAAVELLHNFSLIHDDIEDRSPERRHRPALWKLWGTALALNAGDGMHALAYPTLLRLKEHGLPLSKLLEIAHILGETTLRLCEGQHLDLAYESRLDIGVADYLEMISGKSAALIACAMEMGALVGTEDLRVIPAFRSIGEQMGLTFQIRDDVLGIWGDEKATGKPRGADIRQRKKSLPVVYALEHAKGEARERLFAIYSQKRISAPDVREVMAILEGMECRGVADSMARQHCAQAAAELKALELSPRYAQEISDLALFLVERQY